MAQSIILIGAYGRTYKDKESALKDWQEGKDFKISGGGPYCSIRDVQRLLMLHEAVYIYLVTGTAILVAL